MMTNIRPTKEIISYKNNLYEVIISFKMVKDQAPRDMIDEMKSYYVADTVLKSDGKMFFCRKIETINEEDIQYINE